MIIGETLFYIENNEVRSSKVVSAYTQQTTNKEEIMLTTASNVTLPKSKASFSMQELFGRLSMQYKKNLKGAK